MKHYRIAVLGATGVVGREMIDIIEKSAIPAEIVPLGSERSAGTAIDFHGKPLTVRAARGDSFLGADFVLGAVDSAISRRFAPAIAESGALFIDNSSAFRLAEEVPLVVPEINGEDAYSHRGIISNPNCSTIIALMAAAPLHRLSEIETIHACTYQAVSGAGQAGLAELRRQTADLAAGRQTEARVFPVQIACNVIPFIGEALPGGCTDEEMKMQLEGRRILHAPELRVSCTCVRVPVMRSHSIAVTLRTERPVSVEEAREAVRSFPGCRLVEDFEGRSYPTPLDTGEQDLVWVGRIRRDLTDENGLTLWCCGDQIRKGAASNAVQILCKLIGR